MASGGYYYHLRVKVKGDRNDSKGGKPEIFSVDVSEENQMVESLSSFSLKSPLALTRAPFNPVGEEISFIEHCDRDLAFLKANLKKYRELAERLYRDALSPKSNFSMAIQFLSHAGLVKQAFNHRISVSELLSYQDWFFSKVVPVAKTNNLLSLPREEVDFDVHFIIPLLIHGTVIRRGILPPYEISFDRKDAEITAGIQNEAKDTTLYQLRTGIFDVTTQPQANIGVIEVQSCERLLAQM